MATKAPASSLTPLAKAFRRTFRCYVLVFAIGAFLSETSHAQEPAKQVVVASSQETPKQQVPAPAFFQSHDPIEVTLTANIGKLRGDKNPEPPWRPATISYRGADGNALTVPVRARTRGIWRLKTCDFPPLRLNFAGATSKGSIFHQLDKPKLVSYCQDVDDHEQYVLQEFQLYRIYQLLTPMSHKARLLKLTYADSASGKIRAKRYGFLIEEPNALAARLGGKVMEQKGALPGDLDPFQDALVGVFQYMIGNTDFSINGLHNVELLFRADGTAYPIAYDFDFAGAVNARYASGRKAEHSKRPTKAVPRLLPDANLTPKVFELVQGEEPEIYALYRRRDRKLMDRGTFKATLRYFDEFYETINDPPLCQAIDNRALHRATLSGFSMDENKNRLVRDLTSRFFITIYACGVLLWVPALITSSIQKRTAFG